LEHQTSELAIRQETLRRNLGLPDLLPTKDMASDLPIRTIRLGDELLSVAAARQLLQLGFYASAIFFRPSPVARRAYEEQQIRDLCVAIDGIRQEIRHAAA
jgi:8-amino-7-oxononanoate synthase